MRFKYSFLLLGGLVLLVAGCGWIEREIAGWTSHSKICVDDVQYIQFTSGASVAYNPDGTIKTCGRAAREQ